MSLLKKSIKYFFISFAILLIILLATAYYMLNTVSGMRKTISLVNEYTDYSVSVETIKGGLLGKTEFENFRIAGEGINVASKHLLLDWQFFNLFKKELIVESIVVDDTTVVLPTSQEKPDTNATGAIVLDDIELPINFHLKDVQVNNLTIKLPNSEGSNKQKYTTSNNSNKSNKSNNDIVIKKIQLSAYNESESNIVYSLFVDSFDTHITSDGRVNTKGKYPFSLTSKITNKQYGEEVVYMTLRGELKDIVWVSVQGQGIADFMLSGNISHLLSNPSFNTELTVNKLNNKALQLPDDVELTFDSSLIGTLDNYHLVTKAKTYSNAIGDVPVEVTVQGSLSALDTMKVVARVNNKPITLTGKAKWQPDLDYQLSVVSDSMPPFRQFPGITKLDVNVVGNDKTYQAKGDISIYSNDGSIPASDMVLDIIGTPTKLDNANVLIKTLGGAIAVDAKGNLVPLDIKATVISKNIQPQYLSPTINGSINNTLIVNAKQDNTDSLYVEGQLSQLSGQLEGYPLSGAGKVVFTQKDNALQVNNVVVKLAQNQIKAYGNMKNNAGDFYIDLDNINTKQFAKFIPQSIGINTVISGKSHIAIQQGKPLVTGQIKANGGELLVNVSNRPLTNKIKKLQADFKLENNRLESRVNGDFSQFGKVDVKAVLPDVSSGDMQANIKLNTPNLKFVEYIVPQLNNVKGKMTGDMTVSGNPAKNLALSGKVSLHKTDFNVPQYGTQIREMTLDVFAKNGNKLGFNGHAKAGSGRFDISGDIDPMTQRGLINIKGKNFKVANSKKLLVLVNPDVQIVLDHDILIKGEVVIPKARIVPESTGSKITASEDVILPHHKGKKKTPSSPVNIDLKVTLGDDVKVSSDDISTKLNGSIHIIAQPKEPLRAKGVIAVQTGELRVYGQMLHIERGRVIFGNGVISNPSLDVRASRSIDDGEIVVGANVLGTASKPEFSLFSRPAMADSSILSYLIFGRAPSSDSLGAASLLQAGGAIGASSLSRGMRSSLGLDVFDLSLTGIEAGKNFSKKLYLGMRSDFFTAINQFLMKYKFTPQLYIESAIGSEGISTDIIKIIETD